MKDAPDDIFSMSDEDFLKNPPTIQSEAPAASSEQTSQEAPKDPVDPPGSKEEEPKTDPKPAEQTAAQQTELNPLADDDAKIQEAVASGDKTKPSQTQSQEAPKTEANPAEAPKETEAKGEKAVEPEKQDAAFFESAYKRIMAPFKANGRTIELKTPEEVIQLMQMGANYTRKMQELVPHRKVLTMLQNNGLLDEGKLSFLIDIEKKNPEAIKKLIKDAGIDPMEIDTSVEPAYREGNHRVSDDEVAFNQTLEDLKSTPEGMETLTTIHGKWDQVSKEALWKNPSIMTTVHAQREAGVYDRVVAEITRRQTLGQIPTNVPFLQAYQVIGKEMEQAGAFSDLDAKTPAANAPIETRAAAPKAPVTNNDRAAAASPTRQAPASAKGESINPLAMSDEDFLKLHNFAGRV